MPTQTAPASIGALIGSLAESVAIIRAAAIGRTPGPSDQDVHATLDRMIEQIAAVRALFPVPTT